MDDERPPESRSPPWQALGPHRFAVVGDTLLWSPQGEISEPEGAVISDQFVAIARAYRYVLVLIAGHDSPPLRYEVRRMYADKIKRNHIRMAVAVYGGKAASRVMATLTVHAARLLTGLDLDIRYTATEAEAQKFLDEQRARLKKSLSTSA